MPSKLIGLSVSPIVVILKANKVKIQKKGFTKYNKVLTFKSEYEAGDFYSAL